MVELYSTHFTLYLYFWLAFLYRLNSFPHHHDAAVCPWCALVYLPGKEKWSSRVAMVMTYSNGILVNIVPLLTGCLYGLRSLRSRRWRIDLLSKQSSFFSVECILLPSSVLLGTWVFSIMQHVEIIKKNLYAFSQSFSRFVARIEYIAELGKSYFFLNYLLSIYSK